MSEASALRLKGYSLVVLRHTELVIFLGERIEQAAVKGLRLSGLVLANLIIIF